MGTTNKGEEPKMDIMTGSDIAGTDHIDVCIALTPEECEGTCYEDRHAEVTAEIASIREVLESPEYDLTIETETAYQKMLDVLEQEQDRLERV
ncbi:hypothetical protein SEA_PAULODIABOLI_394 [Microbacterium phage PauloDiaboli]|nr:hypothetical protein SEA_PAULODIABOLI_39 [Microbacterium phage PauloDiaboli]QIG58075.1 hypothetical protein SEA_PAULODIABOLI_394 [Microbacterium phage PauloDiaboli]